MSGERVTKKQQEVLEFVRTFLIEHDYSPSYREIMTALEYKSVSTVASHVEGLITKGFLTRRENSARSLDLVVATANSSAGNGSIESEIRNKLQELRDKGDDGHTQDIITLQRSLVILGYDRAI